MRLVRTCVVCLSQPLAFPLVGKARKTVEIYVRERTRRYVRRVKANDNKQERLCLVAIEWGRGRKESRWNRCSACSSAHVARCCWLTRVVLSIIEQRMTKKAKDSIKLEHFIFISSIEWWLVTRVVSAKEMQRRRSDRPMCLISVRNRRKSFARVPILFGD